MSTPLFQFFGCDVNLSIVYISMMAVGGIRQNSGVSMMAKSLFASLPHQTREKAVGQQKNDVIIEGNNFTKLGDIQGKIHGFHETFNSNSHSKVNIGLHML